MAFTTITSTQSDYDSPVDETLVNAIIDNTEYNYDHALRGGTDSSGVRLAFARGQKAWNALASSNTVSTSTTITYSSDASDGDPNFDSAPIVLVSLEEVTTGTNWASTDRWKLYIQEAPDTTDFTVQIRGENLGTGTYYGYVNWIAIGPVTSGE